MTTQHTEFSLTTEDNLNLFGQNWMPDSPDKIILLLHGIGEHSSRYEHWANRFTEKNIGFCAIDLRGHGKSKGIKGHAPSLDSFFSDISIFIDHIKQQFPNVPLILSGHSMSGNILLNHLISKNPDVFAAIVTSPWIKLPFDIPKSKLILAKIGNVIFPALTQPTDLVVEHISHDIEVVEKYKNDSLVHDKISARLFKELYFNGLQLIGKADKIQVPLLLMHGSDDKITSHKASQEFASQENNLISCKIWDGLYHEIHNELQKDEVFAYIMNWISQLK